MLPSPAMSHVFRTAHTAVGLPAQHVEEVNMLSTLLIIFLVLWLLGVVTSYTMGGFIHILLVVAIVMVLLRVIQGRNPLAG
jgi:Family of unknown function (DUF5670)